jgi:BirA family biotin operon repressor/biotin-[acetyl-CoA-carboxylase] ligase
MSGNKKQNDNLSRLVKLLNTGDYCDGSSIGEKLGITRSAVWKSIKKLRTYGIDIKSVKGKGYYLEEDLILYEKKIILKNLILDKKIISLLDLKIFETLPSTNDYLKKFGWQNTMAVCLAEEQTKGRGRFSRNWYSPFGQNIYLSMGFNITKEISELMGISLIIGLAVINAIKEYGIKEKILIKWPNDILWKDKKIAGILIDANAEINGNCKLIIGVGINLNMATIPQSSDLQSFMSLKKIIGHTIDKNKMVALLINNIFIFIKKFEKDGLHSFIEQWHNYDYLYDKKLKIKDANIEKQGIAKGIDPYGRLILQLNNGNEQMFACGDTTICKS